MLGRETTIGENERRKSKKIWRAINWQEVSLTWTRHFLQAKEFNMHHRTTAALPTVCMWKSWLRYLLIWLLYLRWLQRTAQTAYNCGIFSLKVFNIILNFNTKKFCLWNLKKKMQYKKFRRGAPTKRANWNHKPDKPIILRCIMALMRSENSL